MSEISDRQSGLKWWHLVRSIGVRLPRPRLITRANTRGLARLYMRLWHGLEVEGIEYLPDRGPLLALTSHTSFLDVPALMAAVPYPDATMLALASVFRLPFFGHTLRAWDAIPVERSGRDLASIERLLAALRQGRVVGVAVEGRRSPTGRLGPVNPVLARIATRANVPILPVGVTGAFAAMPRGAVFPRRRKIIVRVGEPFLLPQGTQPEEAAVRIRDAIARLLAPEERPAPGTP